MLSGLPDILRLMAALIFVLSLMGGLALILRRLNLSGTVTGAGDTRRLKMIETMPLDARRRAAIIRCDQKEYLVILGPNGETVVDTLPGPLDAS